MMVDTNKLIDFILDVYKLLPTMIVIAPQSPGLMHYLFRMNMAQDEDGRGLHADTISGQLTGIYCCLLINTIHTLQRGQQSDAASQATQVDADTLQKTLSDDNGTRNPVDIHGLVDAYRDLSGYGVDVNDILYLLGVYNDPEEIARYVRHRNPEASESIVGLMKRKIKGEILELLQKGSFTERYKIEGKLEPTEDRKEINKFLNMDRTTCHVLAALICPKTDSVDQARGDTNLEVLRPGM